MAEEEVENLAPTVESVDLPPCLQVRDTVDRSAFTPEPTVDISTSPDGGVAGAPITHTVTVSNDARRLDVEGVLEAQNFTQGPVELRSYFLALEYYSPSDASWVRLGVASGAEQGYAPTDDGPSADPLALSATGQGSGASYPSAGDAFVGTRIAPAGLTAGVLSDTKAIWDYEASIPLTAQQMEELRDPEVAEKIRARFHAEVSPEGSEEREGRTSVAHFAKQVRQHTAELRDLEVTVTALDGTDHTLTASDDPDLARVDPGGQAEAELDDVVTGFATERGAEESEADYLARLEAAADGLEATASVDAAADGGSHAEYKDDDVLTVDTDPTDNELDIDVEELQLILHESEYESVEDSDLQVEAEAAAPSTTERKLPVLAVDKSGPEEAAAEATVNYEIALENTGSSRAVGLDVTDRVDGKRAKPVDNQPAQVLPGETGVAYASRTLGGRYAEESDTAEARWEDLEGNRYGPLSDRFTTRVINPQSTADPIDETSSAPPAVAGEFLYAGDDPVQTGVGEGAIDPARATVLRGLVSDRLGGALSGVTVSIVDHPELGSTLTEADGSFAMVVNGGGTLRIRYELDGHLPVDRHLEVPASDYAWAEDVALVPLDSEVSQVSLDGSSADVQVAVASEQTDEDGPRAQALIFKAGTTAEMELPDGSTHAIGSGSVRATEYTVGPGGRAAMPADLPRPTAYTYAVELSLDEALAADAETVNFSKPVIGYLENFLSFPVGEDVPVGTYDRELGLWVPEEDGRIVAVLSESNGEAILDVDGSGSPASQGQLDNLGITTKELEAVADLYEPGDELWRTFHEHFSPKDYNYPDSAPSDAESPLSESSPEAEDCSNTQGGSIIYCEEQALGEKLGITGSEVGISYRSDRVSGRKATLEIPLIDDTIPQSLKRIELWIGVAGKRHYERFEDPQPNQTYNYTWDGIDAWGRELGGPQKATVRLRYVFIAAGYEGAPPGVSRSFGRAGEQFMSTAGETRGEYTLDSQYQRKIGHWNAKTQGLGGWTLDNHHRYDPITRTIFFGDGRKQSLKPRQVKTIAGDGSLGAQSESGPARQMRLDGPEGMDYGPDGSLYFADFYADRIRRLTPAGIVETVAGSTPFGQTTSGGGFSGDGGPAVDAQINGPMDVAVASDGTVYFTDHLNQRVRAVAPDGTIDTIAGSGDFTPYTEGSDATTVRLSYPVGIDIAPNGSVYVADRDAAAVREITPDGLIYTAIGQGSGSPRQTDAQNVYLPKPRGLAVDEQGNIYATSSLNQTEKVVRATPEGAAELFAGGNGEGFDGDGGPATAARLWNPDSLEAGPDGTVYILDGNNRRVRAVDPSGIIDTVAGTNEGPAGQYEGRPALKTNFNVPSAVALGANERLYISSWGADRIFTADSPLPGYDGQSISVPASDGSEIYEFSPTGKHLRTRNAYTGATTYEFSYGSDGRLDSFTDGDGLTTEIERNSDGEPTAIIAPYGQRTELSLDANGYLSEVSNPLDEAQQMSYSADGLLASFTNPRGKTSTFTYDSDGLLTRDDDAAGGFKTLSRTATLDGFTVTHETKLGRSTDYETKKLDGGAIRRKITDPAGLDHTTRISEDRSEIKRTAPDGTVVETEMDGDGRFGTNAAYAAETSTTLPGGDSLTVSSDRTSTESATPGLFDVTTQTSIGSRTFTSEYDAEQRTGASTTPEGRTSTSTFDEQGRLTLAQIPDIEDAAYSYDDGGRLQSVTQGDRTWSYAYDDAGYLESVTDPLDRITSFAYDAAGRLVTQTLPDGRQIGFSYDSAGNVKSVTPPGRPAHSFTQNNINQTKDYEPPELASGPTPTTYSYSDDHELTKITRPDGTEVDLTYDSAGRPKKTIEPGGAETTLSYGASSGHLTQIASPEGVTLDLTQDGPLSTKETLSGPVAGEVSRTYDASFRIDKVKVNDADPVAYAYDDDDLITAAGDLAISRDPDSGRIDSASLDQLDTAVAYSSYGELATESADAGAQSLYSSSYVRDDAGRITEKTETTPAGTTTWDYTYDGAGRLTDVDRDGSDYATYGYDPNSNRTSLTTPSGTTSASYDDQDRLATHGDLAFTYSANGELEQREDTSSGEITTYDYDALGNLDQVDLPDGTEIRYLWDGLGRRVAKKVDGQLTEGYLYDGAALNPTAVVDDQGNVTARFVYGSSSQIPDYMVKGGSTYRFVTDQLGSARLLVDASTGQIAQRIEYGPFGEVLADTSPGFQPFGFAGGLYDSDTGLVRFGARDYDAEVGRWTAKDPIGFGGGQANLYGYVLSDPVNLIDPNGLSFLGVDLGPVDDFTGAAARTVGEIPNTFASGDFSDYLSNEVFGFAHVATLGLFDAPCPGAGYGLGQTFGQIALADGIGGAVLKAAPKLIPYAGSILRSQEAIQRARRLAQARAYNGAVGIARNAEDLKRIYDTLRGYFNLLR